MGDRQVAQHRIAVRILGVVSTTHGFAFAVTEGPRHLVTWGLRHVPIRGTKAIKALDVVLRKARPLFVAFEREASRKKRHRGKLFDNVVSKACDTHGIMILAVASEQTRALSNVKRPTKWDVAESVAELFPETADKLPPRRKPWQSEDDRIGLFMALSAAIVVWETFRGGRSRAAGTT